MPHNRSHRPSDESSRTSDSERQSRRQRKANLQNSDEVNRNEERLSPTGQKTGAQRNQTTGSNVPGSEIADRQMSGSESWKQPQDRYTGNSERTGSQYSEPIEDSSQRMDQLDQSPQRKDQLDKSHGSDLSGGQRKKSKGMNAPGKQLHETAEVPRKTDQQREKKLDDNNQEC